MVRRNERRSGASPPELRKPGECLKLNFNNDASQSKLMARKDSEKDSDRPHYYSQFWLDIAAGRRTIGGPRPNDEADTFEPELELDNVALRRPGRNSSPAIASDYEETIAHPEVEPEFDADEYAEPAFDETDLDNEIEDEEIPNIVVEDTEIPDMDLDSTDDEPLAEEVPADEFE